ncbi:MAG: hypothetical protein OEY89_02430 [Gammaproteobacteria bacterium]|nr:hypothetical protein [Gammaproteobacteria bacterium]
MKKVKHVIAGQETIPQVAISLELCGNAINLMAQRSGEDKAYCLLTIEDGVFKVTHGVPECLGFDLHGDYYISIKYA